MSSASSVPERVAARVEHWFAAEDDGDSVSMFRRVFASIWVIYDAVDLTWGMTERSRIWFPHDREGGLVALQIVLVVSGVLLALGRSIWVFGVVAAAARGVEAFYYFSLNDFFFASVVYLILAHSGGGPFQSGRRPAWVRDVLLAQLGWIYVTTGILKLNPDWLDGGQLFVRSQYLWTSQSWPYPAFLEKALSSMAVDARLSELGALGEISLGIVLFVRRPYWLAAVLVVGIHGFGALVTNVWFFSASMAAAVLLLLPRPRARAAVRRS
jgi:Vitamin K-dependent gamma-carboxylase